jgi:colicin import membrane protein
MSARYPGAFVLSVVLHLLLMVGLVLFMWWAQRERPKPQIFELVAGPGDNYAATEAPAAVETVAVNIPPAPVITPAPQPQPRPPTPPQPQPQPQPQPTPPPAPRPIPKAEPKTPPPPKEPAPVIEKAPPLTRPTTYEEFRKQAGPPTAAQKTPPAPRPIPTKTIDLERVVGAAGGSTATKAGAGGQALTRDEMDRTDAYVAMILQRIRESMERAGMTELREVRVEFNVSTTGALSGARIVSGSGSASFDAAVLEAFRTIRPIGPPPTGRAEAFRVTIRMREAG